MQQHFNPLTDTLEDKSLARNREKERAIGDNVVMGTMDLNLEI